MEDIKISPPLSEPLLHNLKVGDKVLISGTIYTARDAAHKRMSESVKIPFDLKGQIIYYCGPSPARPGKVIGSAGPTTASRMDACTPELLKRGLKGMIGKGGRGKEIVRACKKYKALYFVATGGAGALLSKKIKRAKIIAYPELGAEAVYKLEVEDFPVIVAIDCRGRNIFKHA